MRNSLRDSKTKTLATRRIVVVAGLAFLGTTALLTAATASAQDATKVDPKHYKIEFENDQVRVLRVTYGPHEKSVMHQHPASVVVFLTDEHGKFKMPSGKTEDAPTKAGTVLWEESVTHLPENVGDKVSKVILVELKTKPA